jgi:hypothetical protein
MGIANNNTTQIIFEIRLLRSKLIQRNIAPIIQMQTAIYM